MCQKLLWEGLKNACFRDFDHVMAKLFSINWSRVFSITFKSTRNNEKKLKIKIFGHFDHE